jgi:hypothetical protein
MGHGVTVQAALATMNRLLRSSHQADMATWAHKIDEQQACLLPSLLSGMLSGLLVTSLSAGITFTCQSPLA